MLYCTNHKKKGETAGAKAPADIFTIASECGAKELGFEVVKSYKNINITRLAAFFTGLKNWRNVIKTIEKDSWIIIQHPNENIMIANKYIDICQKWKNARFIAIIHDLDSIRHNLLYNNSDLSKRNNLADDGILKKCEYVICHNEAMKKYLLSKDFDEKKIITLGIFDYLHNCILPEKRKKEKSIVIAGNLSRNKCEYLYKLMEQPALSFNLELFGPNFLSEKIPDFVKYRGVCKPDQLPGKLEGSFGLVWDGTEIDRCVGNAGEYIRYNNPHKCSLFLASNMPVIIWREAALAPFIEENGVGITVDSLLDIGEKIAELSDKEYEQMVENTKRIGKKLREGYYFRKAITNVEMI